MFVHGDGPGVYQDGTSLPGDLSNGVAAVGQILGDAHTIFTDGDGIHHGTLAVGNRELCPCFRRGQVINGVDDLLGDLDLAADNGFGTAHTVSIAEAVVLLGFRHGEGFLPVLIQQVACGSCGFTDGVSAYGEDIPGLGMTLGIRSQGADHRSGGIGFAIHHHGIGTAVDDLKLGTFQGCFALGSLAGDGIVLVQAYRAEQVDVDGFVHTPVTIYHLGQDRLGFLCPDVFGTAGLGAVLCDGAVQGAGDHGVAQRILDFRNFHRTKRKLVHIGGRHIKCVTGVARSQIALVVDTSTITVRSKVPSTGGSTAPVVVREEFPLEYGTSKGTVALGSFRILIHLSQHERRVEDRNVGYGDHIVAGGDSVGIGLGVQLVAGRRLGFLDGQHITDVVLPCGCCVAVGISLEGFHHSTVQGDGVLRACQRIQGVTLDLINAGLRRIDGLLQGNRFGILGVGQGDSSVLDTYSNFLDFYLASGVYIYFVAFRGFGFFHEIGTTVETSPLSLTIGIGLADGGTDIAGVGGIQGGIVGTGNGGGAGRIAIQSELGTCQILIACCIGLGQANRAGTFTIGSPVTTQVVEGIGTILCGGIHFRLDAVYQTCTEELIGSALFPDGRAVVGTVFTAQHQLADHGIRGLLHPRTGFKALVAGFARGVGGFQPVLIGAGRGFHIADGIDAVGTTQVLSCNIRPNDGGDQGVAILRYTQLAVIGVQIILDCLIAGA